MKKAATYSADLGKKSGVSNFLAKNMMLIALIGLCALLAVLNSRFLTVTNLYNVLIQNTTVGIVAIGMTFVIITGGIDLSVGSVVALCSALGAGMIKHGGLPWGYAFVGMVAIGIGIGFSQGLLISRVKMPAFIVTLGMMGIARGLTMVYLQGMTIAGLPPEMQFVGNGYIGGVVPTAVVILLAVFIVGFYLLKYTSFGRALYSLGGNREATELSGINVKKVESMAYTFNGMACGIGAIILISRLGSAITTAGEGLELDAIGAAVIGGASLAGGRGTMLGTFIGVMILGVLNNGMNILNVDPFFSDTVRGMVIIIAVLIDTLRLRSETK